MADEMGFEEFWNRVWGAGRGDAARLEEISGEWCAELTGYVDEMPCPVWQTRGRVQVVSIRLVDDGPDLIQVYERDDRLAPLVGPDGEFVFRWIPTPVPVPAQLRALIEGADGG